jgi:hypothetical protein
VVYEMTPKPTARTHKASVIDGREAKKLTSDRSIESRFRSGTNRPS